MTNADFERARTIAVERTDAQFPGYGARIFDAMMMYAMGVPFDDVLAVLVKRNPNGFDEGFDDDDVLDCEVMQCGRLAR